MKTAATQCVIGCFGVSVCLFTFATPLAAREDGALASSVKAITQVTEWDSNVDGIPDFATITTTTYDRQGNLLSTTYEYASNATMMGRSITTNTYDQHRNVLTVQDQSDWNGDGAVDRLSITRNTYDSQGRLLTQAVGLGDQFVSVLTNTYDNNGNLVKTVRRNVDPGGTLGDLAVVTNSYDQRGHLVLRLFQQDSVDGPARSRSNTTNNTYDVHGNLLTQVVKGDIEVDWQDWEAGTGTIASSYDRQGNLVKRLTDWEWEYDRGSNYRSSITSSYDQHRNLLRSVSASTGDGWTYVSTLTNTYDPQGNLLTQVEDGDQGGGILEYRTTSTNSYDQHRNVLKNVYEWDWDGDGIANSVRTTTNTYDRQGSLLTRVVESDYNIDGTPDTLEKTTITYSVVAR
jgi:hypothetical protein